MDNITHSLLGAVLAKTRLGKASPFAPAALVIAANLPDIENFVLAFCDRPTNMIHHRGITHSVVGVLVLAPLFTLVVRWLERHFAQERPSGSFWELLLGVSLALASHLVLDWLNTYGIRPWLPFSQAWYQGDLLFIIDPWVWLMLGAAVCLAGDRTRAGSIALGILGLVLSIPVLLADGATPVALQVAWPVAIAALAVGRWSTFGQRRPHAIVAAALTLAVGYVGFLGWSGRTAWRMSRPVIAAQLPPGEAIVSHTIVPQPADPLDWEIVAESEQAVYRNAVSILDGPGGVTRLPKRLGNPIVRQLAGSREYRAWQVFARHPVAAVAGNGRGYRVYLMDARYAIFPARGFSSFAIDVPATQSKSGS